MTDAATAPLRAAWGWGLASIHASGQVLDTYFPSPRLGIADDSAAPAAIISAVIDDEAREVRTEIVLVEIDLDVPPAGTSDAYLRLHLLSHRLVRPLGLNLDGIFGSLPNVVWTSAGPCAIEGFEGVRTRLRARGGHLTIFGVDKFPRMVDYVVPTGVRVADADRVRLGAHLAEGTTVMHEGFVNFNAGTLGDIYGGGANLGGRGGWARFRCGRWGVDHGDFVRRWHGGHLDWRALPSRRQRWYRHRTRRRLHCRSRPVHHVRYQGHARGRRGGQGPYLVR